LRKKDKMKLTSHPDTLQLLAPWLLSASIDPKSWWTCWLMLMLVDDVLDIAIRHTQTSARLLPCELADSKPVSGFVAIFRMSKRFVSHIAFLL
jgi:hypothetical protein